MRGASNLQKTLIIQRDSYRDREEMKDEIARDIVEEIMTRIHAEEEECSRETSDKEEEAPVEIARDIVEEIMTRIHERDGAHNDAEEEECS